MREPAAGITLVETGVLLRHDIAVAVTTVCRPSLLRAARSVFAQTNVGKIQLLVGVDHDALGHAADLQKTITAECPAHVSVVWLDLGYSTSARHGGVHTNFYGGSLRSAQTMLADSAIVTYLDDDDWFAPQHCNDILAAIAGKKWAFAYSYYADGNTGEGLCVDEMESVGVGKGVYADQFGGFVRPSGLAINKLELISIVHLWSSSPYKTGDGDDRLIFEQLRREPHGCTGRATVYIALDHRDPRHADRLAFLRSRGVVYNGGFKSDSTRATLVG